jgi:hypothetical protein
MSRSRRVRRARHRSRGTSSAAGGRDRQHWPALIARFPGLFWRPAEDVVWDSHRPVVSPQSLADYPWLRTGLMVWPDRLAHRFRQHDHRAQILQNRFWRQRVLLIGGGLGPARRDVKRLQGRGDVAGLGDPCDGRRSDSAHAVVPSDLCSASIACISDR